MSLEKNITEALKQAMKDKNTLALESLRAIKSEILLFKTQGGSGELSADDEIKLLQKLVKQRKDSAELYQGQNRPELAEVELSQAQIISQFLPEQLPYEKVEEIIRKIASELSVTSMKEMGKVMAEANKQLQGKTEGKIIAEIVKKVLQ